MEKYFQAKKIEFVLCYILVFLSMGIFFQVSNGNTKEIANEANMYLTYMGLLFIFYIYICIINRKDYIKYLQLNNSTPYEIINNKKYQKILHKYYPIFALFILILSQNNLINNIPYVWFYCTNSIVDISH